MTTSSTTMDLRVYDNVTPQLSTGKTSAEDPTQVTQSLGDAGDGISLLPLTLEEAKENLKTRAAAHDLAQKAFDDLPFFSFITNRSTHTAALEKVQSCARDTVEANRNYRVSLAAAKPAPTASAAPQQSALSPQKEVSSLPPSGGPAVLPTDDQVVKQPEEPSSDSASNAVVTTSYYPEDTKKTVDAFLQKTNDFIDRARERNTGKSDRDKRISLGPIYSQMSKLKEAHDKKDTVKGAQLKKEIEVTMIGMLKTEKEQEVTLSEQDQKLFNSLTNPLEQFGEATVVLPTDNQVAQQPEEPSSDSAPDTVATTSYYPDSTKATIDDFLKETTAFIKNKDSQSSLSPEAQKLLDTLKSQTNQLEEEHTKTGKQNIVAVADLKAKMENTMDKLGKTREKYEFRQSYDRNNHRISNNPRMGIIREWN